MRSDEPVGLVARMELLAALSRRAQEVVRRHPDCTYQDSDSVFVRDTPGMRAAILEYEKMYNEIVKEFGSPIDGQPGKIGIPKEIVDPEAQASEGQEPEGPATQDRSK